MTAGKSQWVHAWQLAVGADLVVLFFFLKEELKLREYY